MSWKTTQGCSESAAGMSDKGDDIAVIYKWLLFWLKGEEKREGFQAGRQLETNHEWSIWGGIFELWKTYSVSEIFRFNRLIESKRFDR